MRNKTRCKLGNWDFFQISKKRISIRVYVHFTPLIINLFWWFFLVWRVICQRWSRNYRWSLKDKGLWFAITYKYKQIWMKTSVLTAQGHFQKVTQAIFGERAVAFPRAPAPPLPPALNDLAAPGPAAGRTLRVGVFCWYQHNSITRLMKQKFVFVRRLIYDWLCAGRP